MYSYHMYFVIDTLLERLATYNALKFRIHSAFILQVSSHTSFVFIPTTTSIWAMNIFIAINKTITYNSTTNKQKPTSISYTFILTATSNNKAPLNAKKQNKSSV